MGSHRLSWQRKTLIIYDLNASALRTRSTRGHRQFCLLETHGEWLERVRRNFIGTREHAPRDEAPATGIHSECLIVRQVRFSLSVSSFFSKA